MGLKSADNINITWLYLSVTVNRHTSHHTHQLRPSLSTAHFLHSSNLQYNTRYSHQTSYCLFSIRCRKLGCAAARVPLSINPHLPTISNRTLMTQTAWSFAWAWHTHTVSLTFTIPFPLKLYTNTHSYFRFDFTFCIRTATFLFSFFFLVCCINWFFWDFFLLPHHDVFTNHFSPHAYIIWNHSVILLMSLTCKTHALSVWKKTACIMLTLYWLQWTSQQNSPGSSACAKKMQLAETWLSVFIMYTGIWIPRCLCMHVNIIFRIWSKLG